MITYEFWAVIDMTTIPEAVRSQFRVSSRNGHCRVNHSALTRKFVVNNT